MKAGSLSRPPVPGAFLGRSPAVGRVLMQLESAAPSQAGIIICGERGSGRQTLARAIHDRSGRGRVFVSIDCRQIGSPNLEHELFGRSGAAPAAGNGSAPEAIVRGSRLHDARDSTLFLRYPGEIPSRVQARLARVFRDGEAIDATTGDSIRLNIRPIVAIDPPFSRLAQEGHLRDDLYQRLSAIRIDLPALRNRKEDIPALAAHFLRESCRAAGLPMKRLTRQALQLLSALPWRGNVRELQEFAYLVAGAAPGPLIRLEDILGHINLDSGPIAVGRRRTLQDARAQFEREYITAILDQHRGRIAEAARALGIQRTNLYRKMRSLGVNRRTQDS
ncbi:MAG TPA: sigma 54-interacting transcriptional regulator [Vicinamibacterales bacterium]